MGRKQYGVGNSIGFTIIIRGLKGSGSCNSMGGGGAWLGCAIVTIGGRVGQCTCES